ncbi:MAG: hypothetical protein KA210_02905 [Bacteroidia bacterium]|nr:hypothetical protein [Bacteroidia bacterium]
MNGLKTDSKQLHKISKDLRFIEKDFGYTLCLLTIENQFKAKYFFVYKNEISKKQLEICCDEIWFHMEIRNLIDGIPAAYNDQLNCIGFEELINNNSSDFNHFDFYISSENKLSDVITNLKKLFFDERIFFRTDIFLRKSIELDLELMITYKYFKQLKAKLNELKQIYNVEIVFDSSDLSPFVYESLVKKIILKYDNNKISICQNDWRDEPESISFFKNEEKFKEINLKRNELEAQISFTLDFIFSKI